MILFLSLLVIIVSLYEGRSVATRASMSVGVGVAVLLAMSGEGDFGVPHIGALFISSFFICWCAVSAGVSFMVAFPVVLLTESISL